MIRRLLLAAAVALAGIAAAPAAPPARDWTQVATPTPAGGIRIGNPRAPRQIVEVANYTCPHCAHFAQAGHVALTRAIRAGTLGWEVRPVVTHQIGLAATIVARCVPARFLAVNDALYIQQDRWLGQAASYLDANAARLERYPDQDQLRLLAENGGIVAVATGAGVPPARVAACLADPARTTEALDAVRRASVGITATPTFIVGGKAQTALDWSAFAKRFGF